MARRSTRFNASIVRSSLTRSSLSSIFKTVPVRKTGTDQRSVPSKNDRAVIVFQFTNIIDKDYRPRWLLLNQSVIRQSHPSCIGALQFCWHLFCTRPEQFHISSVCSVRLWRNLNVNLWQCCKPSKGLQFCCQREACSAWGLALKFICRSVGSSWGTHVWWTLDGWPLCWPRSEIQLPHINCTFSECSYHLLLALVLLVPQNVHQLLRLLLVDQLQDRGESSDRHLF